MAKSGPGRSEREGLSLVELMRMFPDDETAEAWFIETRWPNGPVCFACGSVKVYHRKRRHGKIKQFKCGDCKKHFSVKAGTLMQDSKLGFQTWALALYLLSTSLKGASSMKLHRDLDVSQKTAWHLAHRIRETWKGYYPEFAGPVEADETYVGGKNANRHKKDRIKFSKSKSGKTPVIGVLDRSTKRVAAQVVPEANREMIQFHFWSRTKHGVKLYSDESTAYKSLPNRESVRHTLNEYVRGDAHTNSIESFWSMFKRGYTGTYHKMSPMHLQRYVNEFAGRYNQRSQGTLDQMRTMVRAMEGKRLRWKELAA